MDAYRDQYATLFKNGQGVTLLAISVDSAGEQASWAKDRGYPFRFLTDPGGKVGQTYGAYNAQYKLDDRSLFVVDPQGKISHIQQPFREIDATAYTELGKAIEEAAPKE